MKARLQITGLCVDGGTQDRPIPILRDVDVDVHEGEIVGIIGASGSGKSTLSLATLGYTRPGCRISAGRILLDGVNILRLPPAGLRRLRGAAIGFVAQNAAAAFNPAIRIDRQVIEVPRRQRIPSPEAMAHALYVRLGLPNPYTIGRRYPFQVSGGQLQRFAAAMAFVGRPKVMIFDEPTTSLDVTTQVGVLGTFRSLMRDERVATIYVSHDLAIVAQLADRVIVLDDGRVVDHGEPERMIERARHHSCSPIARTGSPPYRDIALGEYRQPDSLAKAALLRIEELTVRYPNAEIPALQRINLTVNAGEVVGIIGESGSGKSTLARAIAGLVSPISGRVTLEGVALADRARLRCKSELNRIQIVFQSADIALNPRQSVREILGRPLHFYRALCGKQLDNRVTELLELVELSGGFASRFPGELSGGQKQRINLARALAAEPKVLICDEVTSALDQHTRTAIIDLLRKLRTQLKLSLLFISHDLSTVKNLADRIAVFYMGEVVESGASCNIFSAPRHPYTRRLLMSVPQLWHGWLDETIRRSSGMPLLTANSRIGCRFYDRCDVAVAGLCDRSAPELRQLGGDYEIACHRAEHQNEVRVRAGYP